MAALNYLEPQQLAEMLRGPDAAHVLVIDVREDDFAGGHIKGALNIGGAGKWRRRHREIPEQHELRLSTLCMHAVDAPVPVAMQACTAFMEGGLPLAELGHVPTTHYNQRKNSLQKAENH